MHKVSKATDKITTDYSIALMNNCKWRHVFESLKEYELQFQLAYIVQHQYGAWQKLYNLEIINDHLADGCLSAGPIFFKEIYALKIKRFEKYINKQTGATELSIKASKAFIESLQRRGKFPLIITDDYLHIQGYR